MSHLIIAPILLPLLTAALMLMLGEKHRPSRPVSTWARAWSAWASRCCC
ncbi:hypothetical protein QNM99_09865 [Pseudomonas sp. PCH446]